MSRCVFVPFISCVCVFVGVGACANVKLWVCMRMRLCFFA